MVDTDQLTSKADQLHTIGYLKRKARSVELQAARAAPTVAAQLKSLAQLIAAEADALESALAG